jgi:hypothetical protein
MSLGLIANTLLLAVTGILVISLGHNYKPVRDEKRHTPCSDSCLFGTNSLILEVRSGHVCQRHGTGALGVGLEEKFTICRCCRTAMCDHCLVRYP